MRPLGAGPESILPAGVMDSGFVLRTPRNDDACTATASRSRRGFRASFALTSRPLLMEGAVLPPGGEQGMPGARRARSLACKGRKHASKSPRSRRKHPAFPAQWFYGLFRALPGDRALLPPSPVKIASHRLDASVGAPGPHGFAVRFKRLRLKRHPRPPHPAPRP
jgi:hypothetical protein